MSPVVIYDQSSGTWIPVSSVIVPIPPTIVTTSLGTMTEGTPFDQSLVADGDDVIVWDVSDGILPDGLILESSGRLHGMPTTPGPYSFTVRATNDAGSDTQAFSGSVEEAGLGTTWVFDYADLAALTADGWDFIAKPAAGGTRDTYDADWIVYSPSGMSMQATYGDIYGSSNDSVNTLFHDLPSGWSAVEIDLDWNPGDNWQLMYLAAYQDDDNFIGTTRGYANGQNRAMISEVAGTATDLFEAVETATTMKFRLERDEDTYTGRISTDDGATWDLIGSYENVLVDPRLAVIIGGSTAPTPEAFGKIRYVKVEV